MLTIEVKKHKKKAKIGVSWYRDTAFQKHLTSLKLFLWAQILMISTLSCALKKSLNLPMMPILRSFDYSNFTNHCASFAVISFDFSHSIVERSRINEMSKIENSVLKGWEFIADSVAALQSWNDVRTYQVCKIRVEWNRAHKILWIYIADNEIFMYARCIWMMMMKILNVEYA